MDDGASASGGGREEHVDEGTTGTDTGPDDGTTTADPGGSGDGWDPDEVEVDAEFEGDGASGGAADVVEQPGEFLTEDYWFEGERTIKTPQGTPLLYAMSGAGLYASSFIFAAVGLLVVTPQGAQQYVDLVLGALFFFPIPLSAFLGAGIAVEFYLYANDGDLPETVTPIALIVPVLVHVSLFFVEFVDFGYTQATLAELFAENPGQAQLLLWPPVIMGVIFAVLVYRTTLGERAGEGESGGLLEFA